MYSIDEIASKLESHKFQGLDKKLPAFRELVSYLKFIEDEVDLVSDQDPQGNTSVYFFFDGYKVSIKRVIYHGVYKVVKTYVVSLKQTDYDGKKKLVQLWFEFVGKGNGRVKHPEHPIYEVKGDHKHREICDHIEGLFESMTGRAVKRA